MKNPRAVGSGVALKTGMASLNLRNRQSLSHKVSEADSAHACLPSRVMFGMHLLQSGPSHMGVDLRGRQIAVAQQHLHHPQIGAMVEQMGGKGMTQGVG
jgi:hypothetical protein